MPTWVQEEERRAMTGDKLSVAIIVSAVRKYRTAVAKLRGSLRADGEYNASDVQDLLRTAVAIENGEATP